MVVGIGASAGGLPALKAFFDTMPAGRGLAFVVVQHLDPHSESMMAKILSGHSALHVQEATDGVLIEPDHVYTLPAGTQIYFAEGALRLTERASGRAGNFPIDFLFASLADAFEARAAAVVLSGSGADGAKGVKEVKARGGVVLAQTPGDAEQPSMPEAAIGTGTVDVVATCDALPDHLLAYARHLSWAEREEPRLEGLDRVLALLHERTGLDVTGYKSGTLTRRLLRRMGVRGARDVREYLAILRADPEEFDRLRKDILIGVTSFFRDTDAFAALETQVIPRLFQDRAQDDEVRVWVTGCSTGEEAYTVAMLLLEHRESIGSHVPVRVFATDANEDAVAVARAGSYGDAAMVGLSAQRVSRFFQEDAPGQYRVIKTLREIVTFSTQDLLSDPPLPKLDLICCRNVLIYLDADVQRSLLARFHFCLKPGGYLFLGRSESVPEDAPFEPVSLRWRIFRRGASATAALGELAIPRIRPPRSPQTRGRATSGRRAQREPAAAELAAEWLLREYAPASVVIDSRHLILGFHGPVERFLNLPRGEAILDLLAMPKEGLRSHVRTAVYRVAREGEPLRVTGAILAEDSRKTSVDIRVEPLATSAAGKGLMLVVFEESSRPAPSEGKVVTGGHDEGYVRQIEEELRATKEDLDETIETSEAQHEELQAANEEVTSMNEELRAANEELMASKEELQALNEEVSTTNEELRERAASLGKVTNDLDNLLATTGIATLLLDRELRIVRWTPALARLVNIRKSDAERPLGEITWRFADPQLLTEAQRVLEELAPREREVLGEDERRYARRIVPYRAPDGRIEGVFITLIDVEDVRRAQEEVEAAKAFAENIVETVREPLIILDDKSKVISANRAYYKEFDAKPAETEGRSFFSVGGARWNVPELRKLIEEMLPAKKEITDFALTQDSDRTGPKRLLLNARRIEPETGPPLILLAIEST